MQLNFGVRRQSKAATALWIIQRIEIRRVEQDKAQNRDNNPKRRRGFALPAHFRQKSRPPPTTQRLTSRQGITRRKFELTREVPGGTSLQRSLSLLLAFVLTQREFRVRQFLT